MEDIVRGEVLALGRGGLALHPSDVHMILWTDHTGSKRLMKGEYHLADVCLFCPGKLIPVDILYFPGTLQSTVISVI